MASVPELLAQTAGLQKTVYGVDLIQLIPDQAIIQKMVPLSNSAQVPLVGQFYQVQVSLQSPQGHSFLGTGYETQLNNGDLSPALAGQTYPAQVTPYTYVLRDQVGYQVISRAAEQGKQAFMNAMVFTGKQMALSARNMLELGILHGQQGIGAASAPISTLTVSLDSATTSPGILSILQGMQVQFFQSNLTSARTAHDASNFLTVASVSIPNRSVTLTATGTTNVSAVTTGDVMFVGGSRGTSVASSATAVPFYEQLGIGAQLSATTGVQFNIDKANAQWAANQITNVGAFSPSALVNGAVQALNRGYGSGKIRAMMSPRSWGVLNSALETNEFFMNMDQFSMRKETGTDKITVNTAGVAIECILHPFQKEGQVYLVPEDGLLRVGSTDLNFLLPGTTDQFVQYVPGKGYVERQCQADWSIFVSQPPAATILSGITYS